MNVARPVAGECSGARRSRPRPWGDARGGMCTAMGRGGQPPSIDPPTPGCRLIPGPAPPPAARRSVVVRAEEAAAPAAAPKKPEVGPKRGSTVSAAARPRAGPCKAGAAQPAAVI